MGLRNLGPFGTFIKKAWEKTFSVAKFYCLHVTSPWPITLVKTHGPSMLPTIDLMNVFLGERIPTRFDKVALARGDIIVLRSPRNPRKFIVKRLVGMEGDSITYNSRTQKTNKHMTVLVPKGHIWVQGDNIYNSKDSRHFGPVPYGHIQRRIFWRVWPLEKFGPFWKKHLKLSTMICVLAFAPFKYNYK